jgi:hypothetical protein
MFLTMLTLLWGLHGGVLPQEKPQEAPNTLSQKQISEGWIQLFDGATTFGWNARGTADWKLAEGAVQGTAPQTGMGMLCTTSEFADFELHVEALIDANANSGIMIRAPREGDITADNSYEVNIYDRHEKWPTGSINNVKRTSRKVKSVGRWTTFDILAEGEHFVVQVDGKKTLDAKDKRHRRGVIALQSWGVGSVRFRNVRLKPRALTSLFNGKDLSEWKPLQGRSVYSVTPEGWLNIKDGGGEIQSVSQWGNFLLQLEIFSNGDHLNSGVFFREDPNSYWMGYESQIRNQWQGDDRSKPVDFGTGGLYHHHPARRVVPSDREWFTMTVLADDAHIAIWVNGYQTTDFVDNRKEDASGTARRGKRTKAGVIGLQGHDPTTDLSFRNIRAAELPTRE